MKLTIEKVLAIAAEFEQNPKRAERNLLILNHKLGILPIADKVNFCAERFEKDELGVEEYSDMFGLSEFLITKICIKKCLDENLSYTRNVDRLFNALTNEDTNEPVRLADKNLENMANYCISMYRKNGSSALDFANKIGMPWTLVTKICAKRCQNVTAKTYSAIPAFYDACRKYAESLKGTANPA